MALPFPKRNKSGFRGGIVLDGHKLYGQAGQTRVAPVPNELIFPLEQHIGQPARPTVDVGQTVLRGDELARAEGLVSAPIHASTSGTVVAIEERPVPHASQLKSLCVVLQSDGNDASRPEPLWQLPTDPLAITHDELIAVVRQAGIVGLGGAAFPAAVKLNPKDTAATDTLILNGAECEPYISCDGAAMVEDAAAIAQGALLLKTLTHARQVMIGIEDQNSAAIASMQEAVRALGENNICVKPVATRYPQGGEKQLIQSLTGLEVPSEGLPIDIGIVVHNVGTAAAIWNAVSAGQALTERIVTVTGSGVVQPANLRVRIGTPIRELITFCGGYRPGTDYRLLMGGPMMGFDLASDALPVVKATNCILVGSSDDLAPPPEPMPCIRCGDCVEVCPAGLLPQQLYWHARAHEFEQTQKLNLADCIECGCCAEVCPSNIPLVQYYRFAKTEIRIADQERRKADQARARHEFRLERLEREKQAKEEARRRKREALAARQAAQKAEAEKAQLSVDNGAPVQNPTPASPAVQAALAKARLRQEKERSNVPASTQQVGASDTTADASKTAKPEAEQ